MILDNMLTLGGTIFLIVIMTKSVKIVKGINKSREEVERSLS